MINWKRKDGKKNYYDGYLTRIYVLPSNTYSTIDSYIRTLELREKRFDEQIFNYEFKQIMNCLSEV